MTVLKEMNLALISVTKGKSVSCGSVRLVKKLVKPATHLTISKNPHIVSIYINKAAS
jgi:hypothetical protein